MEDITESVASYREAARHLWNAFFYPDADWNDRDQFSEICVKLFDALVVSRVDLAQTHLPQMYDPHPKASPSLRVVPRSGLRIHVNRSHDVPRGGYWDDPVDMILSPDGVSFDFVNFYDFGETARRDFKYLEVEIREFAKHPHLVGRRALVEFDTIRVLIDA